MGIESIFIQFLLAELQASNVRRMPHHSRFHGNFPQHIGAANSLAQKRQQA
jgi:hypothetical protein